MELSKKDRLILYNQYEILKTLRSNDKYAVEQYEVNQKILSEGYIRDYCSLVEFFSDGMPESDSDFVWDVLELHRHLYDSYQALSPDQKEKLPFSDIRYRGFDGNDECEFKSYADFILIDLTKYEEISQDGKYISNSHSKKVPHYQRMLHNYDALIDELHLEEHYRLLSLDEIHKVID